MKLAYYILIISLVCIYGCANNYQHFSQHETRAFQVKSQQILIPHNIKNSDITTIANKTSIHKNTVRKILHVARKNDINLKLPLNDKQLNKIAHQSSVNVNQVYIIINEAGQLFYTDRKSNLKKNFHYFYQNDIVGGGIGGHAKKNDPQAISQQPTLPGTIGPGPGIER